jgi:hypothetical protein
MAFLLLFALLKPVVGDAPPPELAQDSMAFRPDSGKQPLNLLPHQMDEVRLRAMSSRDCFTGGTREHLCRLSVRRSSTPSVTRANSRRQRSRSDCRRLMWRIFVVALRALWK